MLENKDYCDYETCVALKELGYKGTSRFFYATKESPLRRYSYDQILTTRIADAVGHTLAISLYSAQKFLREVKKIIIEVNFNLMYEGQPRFSWRVLYNLTQHKGAYYTFDSVKSKEDYDSFEEALSECIKVAVKILKENETILR